MDIYKILLKLNSSFITRVRLIFFKCCCEIWSFRTLFWVNKDESMETNNFFHPIGQYISHSYWKQIYCLKPYILEPNHYLFEFSNNNSTIKCEICSKLTIEATDVLVSLLILFTLKINDVSSVFVLFCFLFLCCVWTCNCWMEYFIALI